MRFRLRTLMVGMALVPPALAALWSWLPDMMLWLALFFLAITVACAVLVTLSVPLAIS